MGSDVCDGTVVAIDEKSMTIRWSDESETTHAVQMACKWIVCKAEAAVREAVRKAEKEQEQREEHDERGNGRMLQGPCSSRPHKKARLEKINNPCSRCGREESDGVVLNHASRVKGACLACSVRSSRSSQAKSSSDVHLYCRCGFDSYGRVGI